MDMKSIDKTANLVHNNQMSLMVFQMQKAANGGAETFYGINVFKVKEVIKADDFPVSVYPNSHELIEGQIQLRGTFLPVIDLASWLGRPLGQSERDKSVIIVCDYSHNLIGLRVAHIHGVEEKSWSELLPAKNIATAGESRVVNQTTIKSNGQNDVCYIIDVEGLLAECMPDMAEKLRPKLDVDTAGWKAAYDGKTLLAADDAKSIRSYLGLVLDQLGIAHRIFEDGQQLIDHLKTLPDASGISVIITDLEMPEASGHTVVKFVRGTPALKDLQIAVHSSMTSENNARDVKALGADYFIGKIDTDEITATLKKMAEKL